MVCSGMWWFVVVCGGLWWCMSFESEPSELRFYDNWQQRTCSRSCQNMSGTILKQSI